MSSPQSHQSQSIHYSPITTFLIQITFYDIQLEKDGDFLYVYEGGSDKGKMIANMTGKLNNTKISIPRNQMYIEFHTNGDIARKGFHAKIVESMYTYQRFQFLGSLNQ